MTRQVRTTASFDGFDYVIEVTRRIHEQRLRVPTPAAYDRIRTLRARIIDQLIDEKIQAFLVAGGHACRVSDGKVIVTGDWANNASCRTCGTYKVEHASTPTEWRCRCGAWNDKQNDGVDYDRSPDNHLRTGFGRNGRAAVRNLRAVPCRSRDGSR